MPLVCVKDYEIEAKNKLAKFAHGYYASGATNEHTLRANETSFNNWYIQPKLLRDVSKRSMETSILGHKIMMPIGIAPFAMQKLAHDDGEAATAKAAAKHCTVFTQSTISTLNIEEVAEASSYGLRFFQLYIYKNRDFTKSLVQRAEKAGFKALVLTIDAQYYGIRYADKRNNFKFPKHLTMANFVGLSDGSNMEDSKDGSSLNDYVARLFDQSITWEDVKWLKGITSLPIVLKGILTEADTELAIRHGADAIWVSNHGARQIDGVSPTIEALPKIVKTVNNRCEVYVDGGFRSGSDIFKGLALGANVVFLGRPFVWGLACDGENGVSNVLKILANELDSVMALSGCTSLSDITKDMVQLRMISSNL